MKRHLADPEIENRRQHLPPEQTDPVIEALVQDIISRVADKWTMLILEALEENGTLRFTQIGRIVGDISQKMLTKTLRQMECDGLVKRTVHPVIPPHVDYSLTHLGKTLGSAFCGVWIWAETHHAEIEKARKAFEEHSPRLK
ncbi:winged helix-turn-helix transcriptional regulator [Agrobacterium larrymoorei]|uniref:Helix-turn-helix transcriptional regulator n=1 Tax=Agrobacterium larrymoorei TaxID=160699 RepID=A0A4D7DLL0_9HYPH|nr:helix-turn-helix domain-containing protein [Agrobacterium larrymoorei]QCI98423.1 helix-turn-helix transcriptional regulator [Agrobacterium larrymoorei]QYA06116.1 helix-turn-helix transcriptional regulator [Agrobacterium larrymoorei]